MRAKEEKSPNAIPRFLGWFSELAVAVSSWCSRFWPLSGHRASPVSQLVFGDADGHYINRWNSKQSREPMDTSMSRSLRCHLMEDPLTWKRTWSAPAQRSTADNTYNDWWTDWEDTKDMSSKCRESLFGAFRKGTMYPLFMDGHIESTEDGNALIPLWFQWER